MLDRAIAARGRFPAIDLAHSISRTMARCAEPAQMAAAARLRRDAALLESSRDLIALGAHQPGQDRALDEALARAPMLEAFLAQGRAEHVPFEQTLAALRQGWGHEAP